jgi:hypothetical protein
MAETDFSGDTVALFPDFGMKWWLGGGGTDEWGSRWEVDPDHRDMGQVKNVVLEHLADYAAVRVPDARDPRRYRHWADVLDRAEREQKYVVVCNGPYLFERVHFLHGFENTLVAIAEEPALMQRFVRHVARYHLDTVAYIAEHFPGRIHGYRGTDDWGSQTEALISPRGFDAVFAPVYTELFGRVRAAGMDGWLHSCGQILTLLPHLIRAGVQVVNLMQPSVFPVPRLAAFRGQVCFEVCADMQRTLPSGDPAAVAAEVQALLDACCTRDGGLIEVKLDQMVFDGCGIAPEIGACCHAEYRRRSQAIYG